MDGLDRTNYVVSVVIRELKHQRQTRTVAGSYKFLFPVINTSFWSVQFGTKLKNEYLVVDELASNRARFSFILSPVATCT